jgi:hypothetical protein
MIADWIKSIETAEELTERHTHAHIHFLTLFQRFCRLHCLEGSRSLIEFFLKSLDLLLKFFEIFPCPRFPRDGPSSS